jgi:translocation and assembly module TamA
MQYRSLGDLDDTRTRTAADCRRTQHPRPAGYAGVFFARDRDQPQWAQLPGPDPRASYASPCSPARPPSSQAASVFSAPSPKTQVAAPQRSGIVRALEIAGRQALHAGRLGRRQDPGLAPAGGTRYPLGRIAASRAEIDPDQATGPAGCDARLRAAVPARANCRSMDWNVTTVTGRTYRAPQARHQTMTRPACSKPSNGCRTAATSTRSCWRLDPAGDPQAVPVIVTVRERCANACNWGCRRQHRQRSCACRSNTRTKLPLLGWRADSKLLLDGDTRSIESELLSQPDDGNWRWTTRSSAQERGRGQRQGAQPEAALRDACSWVIVSTATTTCNTTAPRPPATGINETAQAISANYAWTQRNFDRLPYPSSGYGLGAEIGGGLTLGSQREPLFAHPPQLARHLVAGVWPTRTRHSTARAGRIAVRPQAGAVLAKDER